MFRLSMIFVFLSSSAALAAPLPEPLSYAKPSPGGRFVLVVFGSKDAEAKLKDGDNKRHAEGVRAKYPVAGMYRSGDAVELVYQLEGYAPDDNIYLSGDGRYVIRIEGDWWRTKAYTGGTRLAPEIEQAQLEAPAISFFQDGKLLKSHALKTLITDPISLPHSPEHILWPGGAAFREEAGQFLLFTQDANRITFDYRTGEIIASEKMGFGNPMGQRIIMVTLGLTLLMLLAWAIYAFRRLRTMKATEAEPLSPSPPGPRAYDNPRRP